MSIVHLCFYHCSPSTFLSISIHEYLARVKSINNSLKQFFLILIPPANVSPVNEYFEKGHLASLLSDWRKFLDFLMKHIIKVLLQKQASGLYSISERYFFIIFDFIENYLKLISCIRPVLRVILDVFMSDRAIILLPYMLCD